MPALLNVASLVALSPHLRAGRRVLLCKSLSVSTSFVLYLYWHIFHHTTVKSASSKRSMRRGGLIARQWWRRGTASLGRSTCFLIDLDDNCFTLFIVILSFVLLRVVLYKYQWMKWLESYTIIKCAQWWLVGYTLGGFL